MHNSFLPHGQEFFFQLVLNGLIFIFYAIDRRHPQIELSEFFFFLNIASVAFIINYFLFPAFFYTKKYYQFVVGLVLVLLGAFFIEEWVLEQIYFPNTVRSRVSSLLFTVLKMLPVLTIFVGFKFGWDLIEKQRQVEQLQRMVKESELQYLNSQINPHFLFNSLNNLYAHAMEQSPKTPEIILNLSATLRYMLYDCKAKWVPLKKEIEHLENFIGISKLQVEGRGVVHFDYSKWTENYQIAPLILVVFVENAFKHSTASQVKDIVINIDLKITNEGLLRFTCVNTFYPQSNTEHISGGIGLENVHKRLELLYPYAHELSYNISQNKYHVHLSIQLVEQSF
ncbi:MAG: sensor histidine kinase [Aureispira sp.]